MPCGAGVVSLHLCTSLPSPWTGEEGDPALTVQDKGQLELWGGYQTLVPPFALWVGGCWGSGEGWTGPSLQGGGGDRRNKGQLAGQETV